MRIFLITVVAFSLCFVAGFNHASAQEKGVCLSVSGEKIQIQNLGSKAVVIDRADTPDFVATSMVQSVSTAKGSNSYNILLTGLKRNAKKAIISFDLKIDGKAYSFPKNSCRN